MSEVHHGEMVRDFHKKFGFPLDQKLPELGSEAMAHMSSQINKLHEMADFWRKEANRTAERLGVRFGDTMEWRLHLQLQEEAELMEAMMRQDEVGFADALADKMYVLHGTGQSFGIPTDHVFREVHRSNMTKTVCITTNCMKGRGKGEGYVPPDIAGAIKRGREQSAWAKAIETGIGE